MLLVIAAALASAALAADTWTNVATGVRWLERTASGPQRIHVAEIDLCADGVTLRATTSGERGQTVSAFAADADATVAINGDFFSYDDYSTSGLAIGDGVAWSDDSTTEGFVAFGGDRAWISDPSEDWSTPAAWMDQVVGGRPLLVEEGAPVGTYTTPSSCGDRNPHTAVGLSRDRQTLLLVVVDGRSSSAIGMTCAEEADLLADLGAWTALALDGGGSSTLWIDGEGVVNDPSDGAERVVGNHLAVRTGSGAPGSCDWWQDATILDASEADAHATDVDGDGRADLCGRGPDGFACALGTADGFGATWTITQLADAHGWADESNYDGIRLADLDGDGRTDVCARADAGVRCWPSTGAGFGAMLTGPELSDAAGWDDPAYGTTIHAADVNGDGRDDLCGRGSTGFRCWPSNGAGFDAELDPVALSDAAGWSDPAYYGTIRTGDVNGDGRADVCARAALGVYCWLADGAGFPTRIDGPAWSDAAGWDDVSTWSTIRLVDLDGDGRADLCGRSTDGVECARANGVGFDPVFAGPTLSDASGWGDHDNYATLRFGDVDGDGDQDLCARGTAGMYCWLYADDAFATRIDGPVLSDASGWTRARYYATIRLGDADGDGLADVCARAAAGMRCYRSTGAGFGTAIVGPEWSDAAGWDAISAYSTLRFGGVARPEPGDTGAPDSGGPTDTADPTGADTAGTADTASADTEVPRAEVLRDDGCGCGTRGGGGSLGLVLLGLVGVRRRGPGGGAATDQVSGDYTGLRSTS